MGQKQHPEIHTLFRTTPSILLPCVRLKTKCTPSCFFIHFLAIEQIDVIRAIAFVNLE